MLKAACMVSDTTATICVNGSFKNFSSDKPEYEKIKEFLKCDEYKDDELVEYLDSFRKKVENAYAGKFRVSDGIAYVKNEDGSEDALPRQLGAYLIRFVDEKLPHDAILKFWERLKKNPSYDSKMRLFACLESNSHPLLPSGEFLAWKKVRKHSDGHLRDIYSGKIINDVGTTVVFPRNQVDDDHSKTCSFGGHIASFDYACNRYGSSGDVLVEVSCCPSNVVSVPFDYNQQKMRVERYTILKECSEEYKSSLYKS